MFPPRGHRRVRLVAACLAMGVALLTGACASSPPPEVRGRTVPYTNPVYAGVQDSLREAADPGVIRYNGDYYAYITGDPCQILHSQDLVNWKLIGPMIASQGNCWAPDVTYKDGLFYAYLSHRDPGADEKSRRIRLFTSESPTGPFVEQAVLLDQYAYDADYFRAPTGREYLYFTVENGRPLTGLPARGNPTLVARLAEMRRLVDSPVLVAEPSDWECMGRCILEAPSLLERDGRYYMLYSGAAYENETYGQGYAYAPGPLGPGGGEYGTWLKGNQLLKSVEIKVDGPGGGSWITGPNLLEDWVIYHGRGFTKSTLDRWLRIDPVLWGPSRFWLPGAPSYERSLGPALPHFRDLFDRPDGRGLGKGWKPTGGRWSVSGSQALVTAGVDGPAIALPAAAKPAIDYLFEVGVRGSAGLLAYHADGRNWLSAVFDGAGRVLRLEAVIKGERKTAGTLPLPPSFNSKAFQQLQLRKAGDRFHFWLDGRLLGEAQVDFPAAGRPGLFAPPGAQAQFDGVAFTHGWEDLFDSARPVELNGWAPSGTAPAATWTVDAGGLLSARIPDRPALILRGSPTWHSYAFSAGMQLLDGGPTARYGLVATHLDEQNWLHAVINMSGPALEVTAVIKGQTQQPRLYPLPSNFDPREPAALGLIKDGYQYIFYVNHRQVGIYTAQLSAGQQGLIARDARVRFDSVRAIRHD